MGTTTIVYGYSSSTEASLAAIAYHAEVISAFLVPAFWVLVVFFSVHTLRKFF